MTIVSPICHSLVFLIFALKIRFKRFNNKCLQHAFWTVAPKVEGSSPLGLVLTKSRLKNGSFVVCLKGLEPKKGAGKEFSRVVGVAGSVAAARGAQPLWGVNDSERRVRERSSEPLWPRYNEKAVSKTAFLFFGVLIIDKLRRKRLSFKRLRARSSAVEQWTHNPLVEGPIPSGPSPVYSSQVISDSSAIPPSAAASSGRQLLPAPTCS
jgi:hypothetical protein